MVCLFDSLTLMAACAARFTYLKVPRAKANSRRGPHPQILFANPAADQSRGGTHKCAVISCVEAISMLRFRSVAYLW